MCVRIITLYTNNLFYPITNQLFSNTNLTKLLSTTSINFSEMKM